MAQRGALANIDPQPILERIQAGEGLRAIALSLGVSNVGLRAWLLRTEGEQYHEVVTCALAQRVAEADEMLEAAEDVVSIARAREIARYSRMDFERRRPALYGQQTKVTHDIAPDLADRLRQARSRVQTIEAETVVTTVVTQPVLEGKG